MTNRQCLIAMSLNCVEVCERMLSGSRTANSGKSPIHGLPIQDEKMDVSSPTLRSRSRAPVRWAESLLFALLMTWALFAVLPAAAAELASNRVGILVYH